MLADSRVAGYLQRKTGTGTERQKLYLRVLGDVQDQHISELKGNSKAVMSAPALINKIQIALIKMKIPRQLNLIWLGGITTHHHLYKNG